MRTRLFIFAFILCFGQAISQRIYNFNVSLVTSQNQSTASQVLVRFSLRAGQTCPGYEILHSTDSVNYIPVYSYVGICGDQNVDESYSYLHGGPTYNMTNFYKVNIPGYEMSQPQRIYVGAQGPQSSLLIFPNPVFTESQIGLKFINYGGGFLEGHIYNQHGVKLKPLLLDVKADRADVPISDLNDGLYIIWLTDGTILFRNKFIVKRP